MPITEVGYPDFKRRLDYDGELFVNLAGSAQLAPLTFGPFYVGDFGYTQLNLKIAGNVCLVQFNWYADQARTILTGSRFLTYDPAIPVGSWARFLNQGRFLEIQITGITGNAITLDLVVQPSNRGADVEFLPLNPFLLNTAPAALGAGLQSFVTLNYLWAGGAQVFFQTGAAPGLLNIQALDNGNTYRNVMALGLVANTFTNVSLALPPTTCRSIITNTGGVASAYIATVFPSTSGAS